MRKILIIVAVLVILAGIALFFFGRGGPEKPTPSGNQESSVREQVQPAPPGSGLEPEPVTEPVEVLGVDEEQVAKAMASGTDQAAGEGTPAGETAAESAVQGQEGTAGGPTEFTMPDEDTSVVIDLGSGQDAGIEAELSDTRGVPDFTWTPPADLENMAGPNQDPVVSLDFVDNLARHVVVSFYPEDTHPQAQDGPITLLSIKTMNLRYGTQLTGLRNTGADVREARRQVLGYVLGPAMRVAYRLYANRFVELVQTYSGVLTREFPESEGGVRRLNSQERGQLYQVTARWGRGVAQCLRAVAQMEDPESMVRALFLTERAALDANTDFGVALHAFQELQAEVDANQLTGPARAGYNEAEQAMKDAGDSYQAAIKERERARRDLAQALGAGGASGLDGDSSIYVAKWFFRRHMTAEKTREVAQLSAELLLDMADRLDAAAKR